MPQTSLWIDKSKLVDGLFVPPKDPRKINKIIRKSIPDTTGSRWFDMPAPTVTPALKKDLELLKLRSFTDPKRFYKKTELKSKVLPKYFQMGTVIEPSADFYSSRLTKKERKATIADELLSDPTLKSYRKRKIEEITESHRPAGHAKWKINKGTQMKRRTKPRRAIL